MLNSNLELWGGVECSFVRTTYGAADELALTGHDRRADDLDRIAELGICTLRYPVLWDRHPGPAVDWSWADQRLNKLRALGIRPIVGLLHHGCGPLPDGFLAPDFVEAFADFAGQVAKRYPWIDAYTPINEPLTTARFSGMYGLWHPFGRKEELFARIFLTECQATRAAMRAIRAVNASAQLVQTEDIGKTHSTPALRYQAEFENERRWLTFDLLRGELQSDGAMAGYLKESGINPDMLADFRDDPSPPDILGMNHYVTSERLLDENVSEYPDCYHARNRIQPYADVPAVRTRAEGAEGPGGMMRELHDRYHCAFAVTEAQLACTRDEQLRWINEMWNCAVELRAEGADLRAVTAWSLFGAYDWDSLLTRQQRHYESGAFDVSSGQVRRTAVASALRALASSGGFSHPALAAQGWWRRPIRFTFPPVTASGSREGMPQGREVLQGAPVVVLDATSSIRGAIRSVCGLRGVAVQFVDAHAYKAQLPRAHWGVVHAGEPDNADVYDAPVVYLAEVLPEGHDLRARFSAALDRLMDQVECVGSETQADAIVYER